jgi:hypothetical protein
VDKNDIVDLRHRLNSPLPALALRVVRLPSKALLFSASCPTSSPWIAVRAPRRWCCSILFVHHRQRLKWLRGKGRYSMSGGTRGSTLLVRVEDVVLRFHGHVTRVPQSKRAGIGRERVGCSFALNSAYRHPPLSEKRASADLPRHRRRSQKLTMLQIQIATVECHGHRERFAAVPCPTSVRE